MAYSYKTYSDTKEVMKKYVNAREGSIIYIHRFCLLLLHYKMTLQNPDLMTP